MDTDLSSRPKAPGRRGRGARRGRGRPTGGAALKGLDDAEDQGAPMATLDTAAEAKAVQKYEATKQAEAAVQAGKAQEEDARGGQSKP